MNLFIAASRFSQNSLFNVSIIPPVFLILCKYKGFLRKSQRIISFFFRKPTSPPLNLKSLSKTHQSSLTLKGGSTAFPKPFSPQGTRDVPTALSIVFTTPSVPLVGDRNGAQTASLYGWRTIRGLRQQRSCSFLCGDKPAFTQGFAKGLLAALRSHC